MRQIFTVLAACFLISAAPAMAEPMLVNANDGRLYLVEPDSGKAKPLAKTPQMFDIAASSEGRVIGVTGNGGVFEIDPLTGDTQRIGATGTFINSLAFDGNDNLIGAGGDQIFQISLSTGRATEMMRIPGFQSSGDMAIGPDYAMYATSIGASGDVLFRLDLGKGGAQQIGSGIGAALVYGMALVKGRMIGMTEGNRIVEIDLTTGKGRTLGTAQFRGKCYGAATLGKRAPLYSS